MKERANILAGEKLTVFPNTRKFTFLILWTSILFFTFSLAQSACCSGYRPDFGSAWQESSIVVARLVERLDAPGERNGKFQLSVEKVYKGNTQKPQFVFYDLHDLTTAMVGLLPRSEER